MVKKLYILRHTESSLQQGVEDKDRPLSAAGREHAQALAGRLQQLNYRPDLALCSSAKRARETCAFISEKYSDMPVRYENGIYLAATGQLYEILKNTDDKYNSVLLVGHNPGIHGLVQFLVDESHPALIESVRFSYRPGCLSVMHCACTSWRTLMPAKNRLDDLLIGEEITGAG